MLVDRAVVYVKAGSGGKGCESFENRGPRKYYPIGGDGGAGGDIIMRADTNVRDLEFFKFNPRLVADNGQQGSGNKKKGKRGKNLVLKVPIGTLVLRKDEGYIIRDLSTADEEVIVARGGWPGRGNHSNKTPSPGKEGEALEIVLDYQITSDVVFVGTPNSGKSSLIAQLTRARAKSTEYPFSTTAPQLGACEMEDFSQLIMCDLPSLVRGSSEEKGVGNRFLKHALRAKIVYYVLEPHSSFADDLCEAYDIVRGELKAFSQELLKKPALILVNKSDLALEERERKSKDKLKKKHKEVYNISALRGQGLDTVLKRTGAFIS